MHKPQTYYYCCCMQSSFLTSAWHFQSVSWCYGQCYIVGSLLCFGVGIVRCPFILCITPFGDYSHLQYQETTYFPYNTITFQKYFYFSQFSDFPVSLNTTLILHLFHFYSCKSARWSVGKMRRWFTPPAPSPSFPMP